MSKPINNNKQDSYNRRSFPRQNLQYPVHVDCQVSGREFGQILDISLEGIRMLCSHTVKRGESYQLSFRMPRDICGDELLLFEVKSIWTCPDTRPGYCLSGFKLVSFWQQSHSHLALSSAINDYENFLRTY